MSPTVNRTLTEQVNYPSHPKRKATKLFQKSRHHLIVELDTPCRICGVRQSTLNDVEKNKFGATQMEMHHFFVEDSLALAIDLTKFNEHLIPYLHMRYKEDRYTTPFTQKQMEEWIHGDAHNGMILCDVHHRHKLVGIHSITYSIWSVQNLIMDNFDLTGWSAESAAERVNMTNLPTTTGKPKATKRKTITTPLT